MLIWLRNDNNVARVKLKRIETSICSIINIKLSTPIFRLPMILRDLYTDGIKRRGEISLHHLKELDGKPARFVIIQLNILVQIN